MDESEPLLLRKEKVITQLIQSSNQDLGLFLSALFSEKE